jgi:hypothetical protein
MEVQIEPNLLSHILEVEKDISKAISEALNLWLKEKVLTCPITNNFCVTPAISCNACSLTMNNLRKQGSRKKIEFL